MKRRRYRMGDLVIQAATDAYAQDGLGSLRNLSGIYGRDLTEPEIAAGIKTTAEAGDTPLTKIPEFNRLQYAHRNYAALPSLYQMYLGGGFPGDVTDTAEIPGAIDTLVASGGDGGGGGITDASILQATDPNWTGTTYTGDPFYDAEGQPINQDWSDVTDFSQSQQQMDQTDPLYMQRQITQDPMTGDARAAEDFYAQQRADLEETGEHWEDTSGQTGTLAMTPEDYGMGADYYGEPYEPQTMTGRQGEFLVDQPVTDMTGRTTNLGNINEYLDSYKPEAGPLGPMDLYSGAADEGYPDVPTGPTDYEWDIAQEMDSIVNSPESMNLINQIKSGVRDKVEVGKEYALKYGLPAWNYVNDNILGAALGVLNPLKLGTTAMDAMPEWSEEDIAARQYAKTTEQFDPSGALGKDEFGLNTRTTGGKTYVDRVQERQEELKDIIADQKANNTFKEGSFHDRQFKHNENVLAEQGITPTVEEDIGQEVIDDSILTERLPPDELVTEAPKEVIEAAYEADDLGEIARTDANVSNAVDVLSDRYDAEVDLGVREESDFITSDINKAKEMANLPQHLGDVGQGAPMGGRDPDPPSAPKDYNPDIQTTGPTYGPHGGGGGDSGGGRGCVVATHAVNSGAFTPETKREAVRWCVRNLHRTWWGEAIRKGYRYYGQKAIDEGKVKDHYQEFKNYIAFATGRKRTLKTAWTFVYRTVQFFLKGITQWKK